MPKEVEWDTPPTGEVIAERTIEKLTPDGSRPGKVTIHRPVPTGPQEWSCRYVISGVKDGTVDGTGLGVDSVQALFSALFLVGVAFIREPVVADRGYVAWGPLPRSHVDDLVPLPLSHKGLGGADPAPEWLTELDEGVAALRALRDWLEAAKEAANAAEKIEGLVRGMREAQNAKTLPAKAVDISRVEQLRAALGDVTMPPDGLLPLVEKCLLWWTRVSVASRSR